MIIGGYSFWAATQLSDRGQDQIGLELGLGLDLDTGQTGRGSARDILFTFCFVAKCPLIRGVNEHDEAGPGQRIPQSMVLGGLQMVRDYPGASPLISRQ
ncbi:GL12934 [Drosophila persimilis]|uniref:GL12934 n=1 Tax=Drosophila persimilis TaxID=7234 RepID=B4GUZ0_DROPE|nr:GL12934 [Drosophila persimilis]